MNLKGGSCKTTTVTHHAQYLALRGYRVLAMDLDPQASLSALFGLQPELDIGANETLFGAIRYDEEARPLSEIYSAHEFSRPRSGAWRHVCFWLSAISQSNAICFRRVFRVQPITVIGALKG